MVAPPQMSTYIISVLLQREAVELLVPIQSLAALTLMYHVNPRPNDLVHSWNEHDYHQAMWYVSLDVAITAAVSVITVFVLKGLYPGVSCLVILRGVLGQHFLTMCLFSFVCWLYVLFFQNAYGGMDLGLSFEWLRCAGDVVWVGGLEWDCPKGA